MPCSRSLGGGLSAPRGCLLMEGACSGGVPASGGAMKTPPQKQMATVADGTHTTGMHSCYN